MTGDDEGSEDLWVTKEEAFRVLRARIAELSEPMIEELILGELGRQTALLREIRDRLARDEEGRR